MYRVENAPVTTCAETARRVRAARAYAGMSVNDLADRIGLGLQTIKRIECGKRTARSSELGAIATACGLPRDFFEVDFEVLNRQAAVLNEQLVRVDQRLARLERAIDRNAMLERLREMA